MPLRCFLTWYKTKVYFHSFTCWHWVFITLFEAERGQFLTPYECMDLILGSQFCSFSPYVCPYADAMPFSYYNVVICVEERKCPAFTLFFFVKFFGVLRVFCESSWAIILFFLLLWWKNAIVVLVEITLNLRALWIINIFNNIVLQSTQYISLNVCLFLNFLSALK